MIKLVVTDMDGTLNYHPNNNTTYKADASLPTQNLAAIKHLTNSGIDFMIATGRLKADVDILLKDTRCKYTVLSQNGSYIIDNNDNILYKNTHNLEDVKFIITKLRDMKVNFCVSEKSGHIFDDSITLDTVEKILGVVANRTNVEDLLHYTGDVANICIIDADHSRLMEIEKECKNLFKHLPVNVNITSQITIDINHKESTKGNTISHYIKKHDIKPNEVIVVGDSFNDISMFEQFSNSFVMNHAKEKVKSYANTEINIFSDVCNYINLPNLEIIALDEKDCKLISKSNATRIELCSTIKDGGSTPSFELVEKCVQVSTLPIRVMIRNNVETYSYTNNEIDAMIVNINKIKSLPIDGFVFGCNNIDKINQLHLKRLIEACHPFNITYHRAFDEIEDKQNAINILNDLKVDTILTNFGLDKFDEATLNSKVNELDFKNTDFLYGGGVSLDNIDSILKYTNNIHIGTLAHKDNSFENEIDVDKINYIANKIFKKN